MQHSNVHASADVCADLTAQRETVVPSVHSRAKCSFLDRFTAYCCFNTVPHPRSHDGAHTRANDDLSSHHLGVVVALLTLL